MEFRSLFNTGPTTVWATRETRIGATKLGMETLGKDVSAHIGAKSPGIRVTFLGASWSLECFAIVGSTHVYYLICKVGCDGSLIDGVRRQDGGSMYQNVTREDYNKILKILDTTNITWDEERINYN